MDVDTDGSINSTQMKQLSEKMAQMEGLVTGLQDGLATATANISVLTADNVALKADSAALKADNIALKADSAALKADNVALKADSAALKADNVALKADNVALKADNTDFVRHTKRTLPSGTSF